MPIHNFLLYLITWEDVSYGEYYIRETTTPDGFVTMADQYVDVNGSEADGVYEVDVENEEIEGDITLNKTGLGELPAGVQAGFTLLDKDKYK